ncbi:phospholipase a2 [Plakobranchus ocellatus]|uniref:Phospholipase A2 n=1 Tax=Plakobranchus ocellatus TaxID=259542 RepID=A0AAV4B864_9GAST|nr:phospholipase a2 [Plakobranchus ocellatus]
MAGVAPHSIHKRQKRHILQMCELIAQHTNRGCLDYNNYGCFCGLGNAASHHVDAVDGCCRVHDQCYGNVYCYWIYPQFVGYNVDCTSEPCRCTDSPLSSPCAYSTCQCDLQFAQCLARADYNHAFSNYDRTTCLRGPRARRRHQSRRQRRETAKSQWRQITFQKKRLS